MSNLSKLFLLTLCSVIFANCGGNTADSNARAANTNSGTAEAPANSVSSNGTQMQPAFNGETKEIADGFPVPANSNITVVNTNSAKTTVQEKPGPDDSTFSAEMNEKGQPVETRTFRSHPVLKKIEKITMSPRDYVFKIYLKNGKVVESKSEKLKDFRVISPVNILDAIGMTPPTDPNAQKSEDMKKPVMIPRANP